MKGLPRAGGRITGALLLLTAAWGAGRLLQPIRHAERLPGHAPAVSEAAYDSAAEYLEGELAPAAAHLLAPYATAPDGRRVVALLRAADWQSCEDLGRQLRELQRHLRFDSALHVWTEPDDISLIERRLKRERVAAVVSAGPALDSLFSTGRKLPTPALIILSEDGARAEGIAHTRRMPNVRTRSFAEELPLIRQRSRPSSARPPQETGQPST